MLAVSQATSLTGLSNPKTNPRSHLAMCMNSKIKQACDVLYAK